MNKNVLISSLDNKFFEEIVTLLKNDYIVEIDIFHEINILIKSLFINFEY